MTKPIILFGGRNDLQDLEKLKRENKIWRTVDIYENQLVELFEINNPSLKSSTSYTLKLKEFIKNKKTDSDKLVGNWIYFPWSGNLVHAVNEREFNLIRTNRNRNLITFDEQKQLQDLSIGIVGLSVGSNIAIGLAYQGIAGTMKLAEFDVLETSNLNRIRAGIDDIGKEKIEFTSQKVYEINPYANLIYYDKGLTQKILNDFVHKAPKPRVIFEVIDDFEMKVRLRLAAREEGVAVIMFSNLGDSILIDIERYDQDRKLRLFNGVLGDLPEKILDNPNEDKNKYAVQMVGIENVPKRALESVKEIGKTLVGRPQLSSTVAISGALGSYLVRQLIFGTTLKSGRYSLKLDSIFEIN